MSDLLDSLVALYARHGVGGVRDSEDYLELCVRHEDDNTFKATAVQVSGVASLIERTLDRQAQRDQVVHALKLLNTYKADRHKQDLCADLTVRRYGSSWSLEQLNYYRQAGAKLAVWRDYFLSFTNYTPTPGYVLAVNNDHARLIKFALCQEFSKARTTSENLLALLLDYKLRHTPLNGFFYPTHRGAQDVVEQLEREARECFVFVQLLQNTIFEKVPNYCKAEFDAASSDPERELIFVMPNSRADFISRDDVGIDMHGWYAAIDRVDTVELRPPASSKDVEALVELIYERVVTPVKRARDRVYKGVPA